MGCRIIHATEKNSLIHNVYENFTRYRQSLIENISLIFQQFNSFAILSLWQNFHGQQASIVIPHYSQHLRLSHPPLLHRIQILTPEEHLEGEGCSQNHCWASVLPVELFQKMDYHPDSLFPLSAVEAVQGGTATRNHLYPAPLHHGQGRSSGEGAPRSC